MPFNGNTNKSNGSNITYHSNRLGRKEQQNSITGYEAKDKWRRLEVSPEAIDCLQLVREGTYGRVYSGTLLVKGCDKSASREHITSNNNHYKNDNEETRDVLIKTVLGGCSSFFLFLCNC